MMYFKRHLPDMEQWSQSSGSNVIPRRARSGQAGLRPHSEALLTLLTCNFWLQASAVVRFAGGECVEDDGEEDEGPQP